MAYGAPVKYSSGAYKASDVVLAAPLTLQLAEGFNPEATDVYLLFFDTAVVPVAGSVPQFPILLPQRSFFSWGPIDLSKANQEGREFAPGCSYAISSTGNVYTVSAVAVWVDVTGRRAT